jgi:hypothetical protein
MEQLLREKVEEAIAWARTMDHARKTIKDALWSNGSIGRYKSVDDYLEGEFGLPNRKRPI